MYQQLVPADELHARRPHLVNPQLSSAHVVLAVKNFAAVKGVCHIGLGVTATNTLKTLRRGGVHTEAWATQTTDELEQLLSSAKARADATPISHVVVSAPSWVQPHEFGRLCFNHPDIEFVQLNHSGCAYLSIDKYGIRNIRKCIDLQLSTHNMRVAANNQRVAKFLSSAFGFDCLLLTNLYDVEAFVDPFQVQKVSSTLRIGSFGASRPWKNQLNAAEASVMLARKLGVDLELYVNSKRPDGGERMIESRKELFDGLKGCKLIEVPWESWPQFRDTAATMHLLIQPSFDETFNVVTADGIAEGVASVVAPSIEWCPQSWMGEPCDPESLMRAGLGILQDQRGAVEEGRRLLKQYVARGVEMWNRYLLGRKA